MTFLDCSRVFSVAFVGLIVATTGFCLTLVGWFALPINNTVRGVRLDGPVLLLIGFMILFISCLMCAIEQNKCFMSVLSSIIAVVNSFTSSNTTQNLVTQHNSLILDDQLEGYDMYRNVQSNYPLPSLPDKHFIHHLNKTNSQHIPVIANQHFCLETSPSKDQSQSTWSHQRGDRDISWDDVSSPS